MAADDSSPFRRMLETPLKRRDIRQGSKAVPHAIRGKIDVHVPLEGRAFEPIKDFHGRLIERQRHLERKIPVDLEDYAHSTVRT